MAKAWFGYLGDHHPDGPYNSDNYSFLKIQPDFISGTVIGAIYAETEIVNGRIKPQIPHELQLEITIALLAGRPSTNVLLKIYR
jgi:hypothetical protein